MQSSLIPERPLIISPTLAATIGLEESVLLHVLSELMMYKAGVLRQGLNWLELDQQALLDALPFWAWIDVKRVQKSLQDLGLILIDPITGRDDSWLFAINQRAAPQSAPVAALQSAPQSAAHSTPHSTTHSTTQRVPQRVPQRQPQRAATVSGVRTRDGSAAYISNDWQPDQEWLSLCRQHGVPDAFALSLVPGFVMYWRDRAQSRFSWGNAFYKHVLPTQR